MQTIVQNGRLFGLCLVLAGVGPAVALAQGSSSVIIDQDRADRRAPAPAPKPAPPSGAAAVKVEAAAVAPFVLTGVRLEQATAPAGAVGRAFRPFIGKTMDGAALNALTDAAAAAYDKSDIALYTMVLPNQDFAGGVVRLRVVEGYLQAIDVRDQGGARRDLARVRRMAARLLAERPLRKSSFQRAMLLIRDIPGLTADIQLLQGDAPGAVRLVIALKQKPFEVGFGVNNRGTAELGSTQVEADLKADGLLRPGDQTSLIVVVPTDIRRFQYYGLSQMEPIGEDGLTASGSLGYLTTRPASFPTLHGSAQTAAVGLAYPLIRSSVQTLTVSGSFDGVNSDNALLGQSISADHTRALRAAAAYSHTFTKVTVAISATGSFGLDVLGARVTSPLLTDETFKKVNLRGGADYPFVEHWTLRLRAAGQYSGGDRLPAAEQMALGGDDFGRAFPSATVIGDDGVAGSAELGFAPPGLPGPLKGSEAYGFTDGGRVWSVDRVVIPGQTYSLASAGLGVRFAVTTKSVFQVEASRALDSPFAGMSDGWRAVAGFRTAY